MSNSLVICGSQPALWPPAHSPEVCLRTARPPVHSVRGEHSCWLLHFVKWLIIDKDCSALKVLGLFKVIHCGYPLKNHVENLSLHSFIKQSHMLPALHQDCGQPGPPRWCSYNVDVAVTSIISAAFGGCLQQHYSPWHVHQDFWVRSGVLIDWKTRNFSSIFSVYDMTVEIETLFPGSLNKCKREESCLESVSSLPSLSAIWYFCVKWL